MADLADPSDVERRWRLFASDEETETVAALLAAASAMVRTHVPDIDDRITAVTVQPDLVRHVTAEMVARVMRNPDGVSSQSKGPFTDAFPGPYGLVLLPDELASLRTSPVAAGPPPLGTVSIGAGLGYPRESYRAW